jgi:hypothetical protein
MKSSVAWWTSRSLLPTPWLREAEAHLAGGVDGTEIAQVFTRAQASVFRPQEDGHFSRRASFTPMLLNWSGGRWWWRRLWKW